MLVRSSTHGVMIDIYRNMFRDLDPAYRMGLFFFWSQHIVDLVEG